MVRPLLAMLTVSLAAVGVGIGLCHPRAVGFTKAAAEDLRVGMSLAEAEAIIGRPPGSYVTGPRNLIILDPGKGWAMMPDLARSAVWDDDAGHLLLGIDAGGRVIAVEFHECGCAGGFVETWRWRLGRLVGWVISPGS